MTQLHPHKVHYYGISQAGVSKAGTPVTRDEMCIYFFIGSQAVFDANDRAVV
jgi:hypothetical protein